MDYAYKITTHGRAVMAACMSLEAAFRITRVAFGSGLAPEDANLADIHELVEYVSDGAIAKREHKDDRFELTVQFVNSEHPEVKTFLLSEFIVFVEDPATGQETDLLYGTLGDYRQPVPGWNPAFPPSVFNFPLTLILSNELTVSVSAPSGIVTWNEMEVRISQIVTKETLGPVIGEVIEESNDLVSADTVTQLISGHDADSQAHSELLKQFVKVTAPGTPGSAVLLDDTGTIPPAYLPTEVYKQNGVQTTILTIPASAWQADEDGPGSYRAEIACEEATDAHIPYVSLDKPSMQTAANCGFCDKAEASDGVMRFWANTVPEADIIARAALIGPGGSGGGGFTLPTATADRLGGVKVGDGLSVGDDGTISVNPDKVMTTEDLVDEDELAKSVANILNGDVAK